MSWFNGGETNVCYNCLDRHVKEGHGDRVCFFWEGNDVGQETTTTYKQLLDQVCQVNKQGRRSGRGRAAHTRLSWHSLARSSALHPSLRPRLPLLARMCLPSALLCIPAARQ